MMDNIRSEQQQLGNAPTNTTLPAFFFSRVIILPYVYNK